VSKTDHRPLNIYMISLAAHFAAGGMMGVVFPWLIVHELHLSQAGVGLAQMIAQLPMMLLILVGGAAADGRDLRGYLANLQLAAAIVPIVLAVVIASGQLSFYSATSCLFVLGIVAAFVMPARDSLLSYVSPPSLGLARTSALAVAATFGGQLVGTAIAASASTVGAVPLLCLQAALLVFSAVLTARLKTHDPHAFKSSQATKLARLWPEMVEGFKIVRQSERLRTIILYLTLSGPLFNGMFLVGLPLIVRDVYYGSSAMLSGLLTAFLLGLTVSSFAISRIKPAERPGRQMMLITLNNVIVFTAIHFAPPFPVCVALIFFWGIIGGISMATTRGLVQAAAPHEYRARVLSVLQFANVAGGPLGALLYGVLAQAVGILNALLIVPVVVVTIWLAFRFLTNLWHFRREDPHHQPVPPAPAETLPLAP
jgi:MFS family permease